MSHRWINTLQFGSIALVLLFIMFGFQNCSSGKFTSQSQALSSSGEPSGSGGAGGNVNGCSCGSADSVHPCLGNKVTYTAGTSTISYEFQCDGGPCKCGIFANQHDFWVAPGSPNGVVKITSMLPATLGTAGETDYRNGWVVNPDNQNQVGLDGRFYKEGNHKTPQNPTLSSPYIVDTATGVQSIWKADHYPDAEIGANCMAVATNGDTRMCFLQTALLTVLPNVPENSGSTVIRPAYFGATKTLYTLSQLDLKFFPSFAPIVRPIGDAVPLDWDKGLGDLAFADADWGMDYPATQVHHARYDWHKPLTNGYPAYTPQENRNGALALLMFAPTNPQELAKKELLKIRAVQQGLDILGIIKHGNLGTINGQSRGGYRPNGGHQVGRYTQALIAAQAISKTDPQWKNLLIEMAASSVGKFAFPETGQFTFNAVTGRYTYGTTNVTGGPTYYPDCSSGLKPCQSVNSIMADPDGRYDDWPEDGTYGEQGHYQAIAWNSTLFAATMARATPALRGIIYSGTQAYVNRMVTSGTYTNTSVVQPIMPISYCLEGLNKGLACRTSNDCGSGPTSSCVNRVTNFSSYIWPAVNLWQTHDACLNNKTCPGMEGL